MLNERNIFEDDNKLIHLCEDFLHQVSQMEEQAKKDPEKTPTPTKLIEILRYENDPIPLTMEEYQAIADFIGDPKSGRSDYADWKLAKIETSAASFLSEDGTPKNIMFDSMSGEE